MSIIVTHHCIDVDDKTTVDTLFAGKTGPRNLAKAVRIYNENVAEFNRIFGPGTIRPKHFFTIRVDNNVLEDYDIFHIEESRKRKESWKDILEVL